MPSIPAWVEALCALSLTLLIGGLFVVLRLHVSVMSARAEIGAAREKELALNDDNLRLRRENNRHNYDIMVLYQFLNNLAGCRRLEDVYQELMGTIQQSIDPEAGMLFIPGDGGSLILAAHRRLDELAASGYRYRSGQGLIGWIAANRREVYAGDTSGDNRFPELSRPPFAPRFKTAIALPLLCRDRLFGVVAIGRSVGSFSQDELRLLFVIANEGALHLQNLQLYGEVAKLAITDGTTGLYNHRHFFEQAARQFKEAEDKAFPLSLLMIDIDNFKPFNDTYGHLTGDAILGEVARLLLEKVGPGRIVARYGGEEFAVLLPRVGAAEAGPTAEAIRRGVEEYRFTTADGDSVGVTVSIGMATYPDHLPGASSVTDLIAAADHQLMARAKSGGRNRVCIASTINDNS